MKAKETAAAQETSEKAAADCLWESLWSSERLLWIQETLFFQMVSGRGLQFSCEKWFLNNVNNRVLKPCYFIGIFEEALKGLISLRG